MFRLRLASESQARRKKGAAPQSTTGLAIAICSQPNAGTAASAVIGSITSGAVSSALTARRRVMVRSSPSSSGAAETVLGSSAMPQAGQAPGPGSSTSGCIGQVYRVRPSPRARPCAADRECGAW